MVRAPEVWEMRYQGKGQVIGFIDSGIDTTHPILRGRLVPGGWFDAVNDSALPYDDYGHGTHVSGIAGGTDGYGIAPKAQFAMAKALASNGGGYWEDMHEALQWYAENGDALGVRIISNSWGTWISLSLEVWPDFLNLQELGFIPIFASGNSGSHTCAPGNYPIVFPVGATDFLDSLAYFSSRGPAPDTIPWNNPEYWPRDDWNLIVPAISAPGVKITSSLPNGEFATWDGTSMACPHVAGAIALMLEKNPELDFKTIYQILTDHNFRLGHETYPANKYGWGRLDIYRAMLYVKGPTMKPIFRPHISARPNPLIRQTRIRYSLPEPQKVTLTIYNIAGQLIKTLERGYQGEGLHSVRWNGLSQNGQLVKNGIYFCHLQIGCTVWSEKLIVLR